MTLLKRLQIVLLILLAVPSVWAQSSEDDEQWELWEEQQRELLVLEEESADRLMPLGFVIVAVLGTFWLMDKLSEPSDEAVQASNDLDVERRYPGSVSQERLLAARQVLAEERGGWLDMMRELDSPEGAEKLRTFLSILEAVVWFVCAQILLALVCGWRIFRKAGRRGWSVLIPIYNFWVLFEVAGVPAWLSVVPALNLVLWVLVVPFGLAKRFERSWGFGLGLALIAPVFYPLLAFVSSRSPRLATS